MTDPVIAVSQEAEEWLRPSPRFSSLRRLQAAVLTAVAGLVVIGLTALETSAGRHAGPAVGATILVVVLVGGFLLERLLQRRVRSWAYCERADDLLVKRGVMITRLSVVPYGRMQFIDVVTGPVERLFGLATVRMHTAAAASGARIPGLSAESAAVLRDHLAALGESKLTGL